MAQIIQNISVDVSKPNFFQAIVAKQYDSGSRFLKATLIHCGKTVEIDPTSTVLINAKRSSDGEEKAFAGVANDDNTVTVPLAYWMLEFEGTVKCDISVIGADGTKLTSTSFTVEVESASCNSGDVSEDENYDVLVKLIEDVSKVTPDQAYNPESENAQSGKAVAEALESLGGLAANATPITEACNVWELESGIYSVDTDATGAMVSLSNAGDWFYYGLLTIADTTSSYGGKTFLVLGCDENYTSVVRIGVVDLEGSPVEDFPWGNVLTDNCAEINTIKDRLDALEQQAQIINEISTLVGGEGGA